MNNESKKRIVIIVLMAIAVLLVVVFALCYFLIGGKTDKNVETTTATTTNAATAEIYQDKVTETKAKATTTQKDLTAQQPVKLTEGLKKSNLSYADLDKSKQLIFVYKNNGGYRLCCFENKNGVWEECFEDKNAYVGLNGTVAPENKTEGDKKTPVGLYSLGFAFGTPSSITTELEYRQVTNDVYWVDDVNSLYYNKWVDASKVKKDWNHAEHMSEYPGSYEYGITVNFNTDPIEKGKGSAIFIHCGEYSTLGCVAINKDNLINILAWLKKDANARILIVE